MQRFSQKLAIMARRV